MHGAVLTRPGNVSLVFSFYPAFEGHVALFLSHEFFYRFFYVTAEKHRELIDEPRRNVRITRETRVELSHASIIDFSDKGSEIMEGKSVEIKN